MNELMVAGVGGAKNGQIPFLTMMRTPVQHRQFAKPNICCFLL